MAFEKLAFEKTWTNAENFPTYESNEAKVREDMQYHPDALKDFINKLIDQLEAIGAAGSIGAADAYGGTATIQSVLDGCADQISNLEEDLNTLAAGGVPSSAQSTAVSFNDTSWATGDDGLSTLTIPYADHKRGRSAFGYQLYQKVDDEYRSGTWGAATTRVVYDESSGNITLLSDEGYTGRIVFFGL